MSTRMLGCILQTLTSLNLVKLLKKQMTILSPTSYLVRGQKAKIALGSRLVTRGIWAVVARCSVELVPIPESGASIIRVTLTALLSVKF